MSFFPRLCHAGLLSVLLLYAARALLLVSYIFCTTLSARPRLPLVRGYTPVPLSRFERLELGTRITLARVDPALLDLKVGGLVGRSADL